MPPHSRPAASSFRNQARTTVKRCSAALCAALLLALGACGEPDADLPSDAYVWQRIWTAPVTQAMSDNADVVRAWRVLMAEMNADGRWFTASPDLAALAAAKRPVVMVVRLDGRAGALPAVDVLARISAARSAWSSAGISLAGVEIDYDCPTSKLPLYAAFLAALKKEAGPDLPLSITALPTWLNSPALDALLRIPDEAVLQVHAVLSPEQGLFQARRAQAWLAAFAERTQRPWRVALPTYGSRVVWSDDGSIAAIESERPALLPGGRSSELVAAPAAMAAFVDEIQRSPPRGLAGIAWFRLPTASDERAWSLATWRAVLTRQPLLPALSVTARSAGGNNAQDLILANSGSADAALPFAIRWDGACRAADGINGYSLEHDAGGAFLRRSQDGLLRAGSQRNIGWIRCENGPASFHVQP
ncbi:DUF3142 domain-containing protein [Achromobacter sp. RTa]|uniref:DUF3142 domain-containing protein n=1 Tax=Achromobacter sp. RTa TaxID=1532557 RepID=UPI0009DDA256|nr:DUF3142 domain-containing protein [Achromobacter sp. RTa]